MYLTARNNAGISQLKALTELMISQRTITRYENGESTPPPETALKMADIYDTPELTAQYCKRECAIGRRYCYNIKKQPLTDAVLHFKHALNQVEDRRKLLTKIAYDGIITSEELTDAINTMRNIMELEMAIEELKLSLYDAVDIPQLVRETNEKHGSVRQTESRVR